MVDAQHIRKVSWQDIERLTDALADTIIASKFSPEALIGITSGGLVPLVLLGKALTVRDITCVHAYSYDKHNKKEVQVSHLPEADFKGKNVLLVDEIVDSGETMKLLSVLLKDHYQIGDLRTATLITNTAHTTFQPDYSVETTSEWIVFPWERREYPEYF